MQKLGVWRDVSHLLQKQHETVFFVVKSYKMWVGGVAYIYIYMHTSAYIHVCVSGYTGQKIVNDCAKCHFMSFGAKPWCEVWHCRQKLTRRSLA